MPLYLPDHTPSWKQGFATSAAEARFPQLWKGLKGLHLPVIGPTGSALKDFSGLGNHGIQRNMAASNWIRHQFGWALDFNGSTQFIDVPSSPALPDDLTICVGLTPASTTDQAYISDYAGTNEFALIMAFQNGFYNVFGGQYPTGSAGDSQIPMSGAGIRDSVCWTKKGTTIKGFVNGQEHTSVTITGGDFSPDGDLNIGVTAGEGNHMEAILDSFITYGRAVSPDEAKLLVDPFAVVRQRARLFPVAVVAPPAGGGRNHILGGGIIA